jgi:hypothetical protein
MTLDENVNSESSNTLACYVVSCGLALVQRKVSFPTVIITVNNQSGDSRGRTRKSRNREIELELSSTSTLQI